MIANRIERWRRSSYPPPPQQFSNQGDVSRHSAPSRGEDEESVETRTNRFVIAALGASAGGLEALENFFKHTPPDTGIGFIVVQHLAPDHKSSLPELLARHTEMPVEQARDKVEARPNRIYIIPPNAILTVEGGRMRVRTPESPRGQRMPIDALFRSLAEDREEFAVCIILSGTGSDGTAGLGAIKEKGGMAMAQSIETAKYDTILRSAIATGLVDHILSVEEMPAKLIAYASHLGSLDGKGEGMKKQIGEGMGQVFNLLRRRMTHDFSGYKLSTIARRLQRRMKALQVETVGEYVEVLESQPEEAGRLFNELLVGVTEFFRDPEAFEALAREVIPKLFENNESGDDVRACIVGCATGEEAYSIAILLAEHASTLKDPPKIQVFATDIDQRGLEIARRGIYPSSIAGQISEARLDRFFIKHETSYQVKTELRDLCIFSQHSFLKDPPFSRQDLISCRNVMIYLGPEMQERIVFLFHYALRRGGFLFLGPSESITHRELFGAVDKKYRIFQRKDNVSRAAIQFSLTDIGRFPQGGKPSPALETRNIPKQLESVILQRYAPACVVVQENGEAVYLAGPIDRYLRHATGSPDNNVLNTARDGLRIPLRTALYRATTTHERIEEKQVSVQTNGSVTEVDLSVEPLAEFPHNLYIVVLNPVAPRTRERRGKAAGRDQKAEATIRQLENEIRAAQERAQTMFEELETSNEELKSANEEYQSTNEELETSKEELQSFNEELQTVNTELLRKNTDLDSAYNDLQNLLDSTELATVFLDLNLRIKKFTPAAARLFRLIAGDRGRPISDLVSELSAPSQVDFENDMHEVLKSLSSIVRQVTATGGRHFQMRIMPYRTTHNVIDGVVVTFTDVTPLAEAKKVADEATAYAENIVNTVREPLVVLDSDLRVRSASDSFYKIFDVTPEETLNRLIYELGNRQWDIPELRRILGEILAEKKSLNGFHVSHDFGSSGRKTMVLNARIIQHGSPLILLAIEDITDRELSEEMLLSVNADLKQFAFAVSHDLQEPLRMVTSYTQLLAKEYREKLGKNAETYIGYAVEGAQRMETLLKDLRNYWAVNEEKLGEPVRVDCNAALKAALDVLAIPIKETGAVVTHDPLPAIRADEVTLALLFQNLIGNALKYHRDGIPPKIHISAQQNHHEWNFAVRDNGIGIEEENLKKIFAPFKRLHGREIPGSGIGLAICQKIVTRYRGRIWAESEYGKGSTFHFTFPADEQPKE